MNPATTIKRTRAEGLDPDGLAVRAALDFVRWELELLGQRIHLTGPGHGVVYEFTSRNVRLVMPNHLYRG